MWRLAKVLPVLALIAVPVRADLAVKFLGTAPAGNPADLPQDQVLSPEILAAMAATGVAVGTEFGCFERPIVNLRNGKTVGIGVDCLNIFGPMDDSEGDGAQIEAKTFFFMPRGTLVNHGCTSVRPFFAGVGDSGVTHMTGSIGPAELGGNNSPLAGSPCESTGGIVHATRGMRKFLNGGEVRLSGAVDLSDFGNGNITFSCIFVMKED